MPWLSEVAAVVEAWYPGEQGGVALASLLFGDANFSGKLSETFPASDQQGPGTTPADFPGLGGRADYAEVLEIGYRYYDAHAQGSLFPFGHGLSYTAFRYDSLTVRPDSEDIDIRVRLTNVGARRGAEVAQLYVRFPASAGEPPLQIKGFRALRLGRGEASWAAFRLHPQDLPTFDGPRRRRTEPSASRSEPRRATSGKRPL